ncbi:hypothetical protein OLX02_00060 [Novosphingobium sp. KCTC 2891]|uniref:hypothetical protein n=1 Tax=Novosphingobium sp. KCTC 2891 TaxID=2989730 RepID=UPI0022226B07|nr:hypothetical protein [Novosphingobium sp. KCTC 2891]MCW1381204.1 hypothetical protein [Novosphingobium sp. KCTC 2891]
MRQGAVLAAALASLVAGQAAQAANCAGPEIAEAARVVEFEAMMMAVSLRCARAGVDMRPTFDRMVGTHAARFGAADTAMHRYFAPAGPRAFDRYATGIANKYGGGATDGGTCRVFNGLAGELASPASDGRVLGAVVRAMIRMPEGLDCPAKP